MTDTFVADREGNFWIGKALTCPDEEYKSYMSSVGDAAESIGMPREELHKAAAESIYTGTTMLNLLLTQKGLKVGLLTTKGFKDDWWLERGLTWLGKGYEGQMHIALHEHTPRLSHYSRVRTVTERILGPSWYIGCHEPPGTILFPMKDEEVEKAVGELLDEGVEVIGILFLHSYINPIHELRAAEIARRIVKERGSDVDVIASYDICPQSFHNERLKTLLLQCYCSIPAARHLYKIDQAAKNDGFKYGLETFLSYGATVGINYPRMVEAVISGPTGGLTGGYKLLHELKNIDNIVCCDLGGTTFDVGIIARGQLPIEREPEFAGHKIRIPMLDIDSIGQGTGMAVHVDANLRKVHLGPESAGSRYGTSLDYPIITIGDIDVALGYISPDYFLGGKVKLNRDKALEELDKQLARPLGMDLYKAAAGVLEMMHSSLREHILSCVLSIGHRPEDYTLLVYGGSGPLHLWGMETAPSFGSICTVPWAGAFSAFGIAMSDYFYRRDKTVDCVLPTEAPNEVKLAMAQSILNSGWQELESGLMADFKMMGITREDVEFHYKAAGRYLGQMHSWEFPVNKGRIENMEDLGDIIDSFESVYLSIYPRAARFPEAGYAITEITCEAYAKRAKPAIKAERLRSTSPSVNAFKESRQVYYDGQWMNYKILEMDLLEPGNQVDGPAIIEHTMTTLVVPPARYIKMDGHRVIWYYKNK
jgi:N-methylhydantoinase A